MTSSAGQVTQLLKSWSQGDQEALGRLMPVVYGELRRLARRQMARERPDHTLQVTALVHEAYLRCWMSAKSTGRTELISWPSRRR